MTVKTTHTARQGNIFLRVKIVRTLTARQPQIYDLAHLKLKVRKMKNPEAVRGNETNCSNLPR